ncbi:hypothetical protein ASC84_21990 [Acinetobacter sp. Root1280]|uniref:hypothetical protein n=1 Tax=Acinetobacter sp. Root1280 TaxID=1736444 RepID=UPI0006FE501D|nr:hypothetical protein [Acinetobacter sp. Root1280]KQW96062.1 hypothetical protein ASC84_21990 [Acinetobacter sp. Root1280]
MKIYEMIFHKGNYEQNQSFYAVNNKATREHFLDQIRLELDVELNDFKLSCTSDNNADLLSLFKEVHHESFLHVNAMADEFIQNSKATFDQFICLNVEEHDVLDI